ncbi:hypothetical protein HYX70_04415 [Candidatus Saccharibacteria bacterium]|nr:hypothetical protein [Candidatus Saccharibacteria bacterium]
MSSSEETTGEYERRNPLLDFLPHRLRNWDNWYEMLLNPETPLEVQIGLLHCGFGVEGSCNQNAAIDRMALYLRMADGHLDHLNGLYNRERDVVDDRRIDRYKEGRQTLAAKAFAVTSEQMFRQLPEREGGKIVSWTWLEQPDMLELFVWFLRSEDPLYSTHRTYNLQDPEGRGSKPMEWAVNCGKWLCELAFYRDLELDSEYHQGLVAFNRRLVACRPQLLPFMRAFKLLHLAEQLGENLDKATLTALRKMAMNETVNYGQRKPASIKDAAASGSYPGRVCFMIDTIIEENKRRREVAKAHAEAAEAKARAREAEKRAKDLAKSK